MRICVSSINLLIDAYMDTNWKVADWKAIICHVQKWEVSSATLCRPLVQQ